MRISRRQDEEKFSNLLLCRIIDYGCSNFERGCKLKNSLFYKNKYGKTLRKGILKRKDFATECTERTHPLEKAEEEKKREKPGKGRAVSVKRKGRFRCHPLTCHLPFIPTTSVGQKLSHPPTVPNCSSMMMDKNVDRSSFGKETHQS